MHGLLANWMSSLDMQRENAIMDMQHGDMDMQHGDAPWRHEHEAWSSSVENNIVEQHGHAGGHAE